MTNVMEVQQELISRLVAASRAARRVPDESWLRSTLASDGEAELVGLLQTVYPYTEDFSGLPAAQRELLLERVRSGLRTGGTAAARASAGGVRQASAR